MRSQKLLKIQKATKKKLQNHQLIKKQIGKTRPTGVFLKMFVTPLTLPKWKVNTQNSGTNCKIWMIKWLYLRNCFITKCLNTRKTTIGQSSLQLKKRKNIKKISKKKNSKPNSQNKDVKKQRRKSFKKCIL